MSGRERDSVRRGHKKENERGGKGENTIRKSIEYVEKERVRDRETDKKGK